MRFGIAFRPSLASATVSLNLFDIPFFVYLSFFARRVFIVYSGSEHSRVYRFDCGFLIIFDVLGEFTLLFQGYFTTIPIYPSARAMLLQLVGFGRMKDFYREDMLLMAVGYVMDRGMSWAMGGREGSVILSSPRFCCLYLRFYILFYNYASIHTLRFEFDICLLFMLSEC